MLKVKTKLKESSIHGIGLFADEFIAKGTLIFQEDDFTIKIKKEDLSSMDDLKIEYVKKYCYLRDGIYHCSMDNDRFTNHSEEPNVFETETETYAAKDILPDEEITTNYESICVEFNDKIEKK